ncbi:MAG: glycosyltransferase family 39 protein [Egibacteraceae bacterium]
MTLVETRPACTRQSVRLAVGLAVVVMGAAALRVPNLVAHLPAIVQPDEPTVVERGLRALGGQLAPQQWDWPPLSGYVYAAAAMVVRVFSPGLTEDVGSRYLLGRILFLGVSLVAVALTGVLGARLADDARWRALTGVGAAAALALSYTSVRLSRIAHPEHLQIALMLGSALCALSFDRSRRWRPLAAAGVLAGLAGATKYLGVTVGLVPLLAVLVWPARAREKATQAGVLCASALVGFVGGTFGTVLSGAFLDGFAWQVRHQAGGHLGYEAAGSGWLFHLTQSLPGTWGWPLTVLGFVGLVAVLARGTRAQRLVAVLTLTLAALVGSSQVRFPHYTLIAQPLLAVLAFVALTRVRRTGVRIAVTAAVAVSVGFVALDDVRLVRADGAPSTRLLASSAVAGLPGPVWSEGYSLTTAGSGGDRQVVAFGTTPAVLDCGCVAVVSSYQEERYRRRPDLYPAEIAVYDALRERGRLVAEIASARPLSYRWDLLPAWGLADLPLTGPLGPLGPTITVLDLGVESPG